MSSSSDYNLLMNGLLWLIIAAATLFFALLIVASFQGKSLDTIVASWVVLAVLAGACLVLRRRTDKRHRTMSGLLVMGATCIAFLVPATAYVVTYQWRCPGRVGPNAKLVGCNLTERDLRGKNLRGADLTQAVLVNADLTGAVLSNTVLDQANLDGAIGLSDQELARNLNVGLSDLPDAVAKHRIRLESRTSVLDRLRNACLGGGVAGASTYRDGKRFHPLVMLNANGTPHKWNRRILRAESASLTWEPMALRFCELVACVQDKEKLIEFCPYVDARGVSRYQHQLTVRLLEARTGALVAERIFRGTPPRECEKRERESLRRLSGKHVEFEDLSVWLTEFVFLP